MPDNASPDQTSYGYTPGYYAALTAERERSTRWHRVRLRNIVSLIRPTAGERLLDLGCGIGNVAYEAARQGAQVIALDSSSEAVALTRELCRGLNVEVTRAEASSVPFPPKTFDKVVCADFLEHLTRSELRLVLRECGRVLREGGLLIVYSPCPTHLFERMRVWGLLKADLSHVGLRTLSELKRLLEEEGLQVAQAFHLPSHLPVFSLVERLFSPLPGLGRLFRRRVCLVAVKGRAPRAVAVLESRGSRCA